MKRLLCWFSILLLFIPLFGCSALNSKDRTVFYYPRAEFDFKANDGILSPEHRDETGANGLEELLTLYLAGPMDPTLKHPFPENLKLVSARSEDGTLYVTVSDHMAKLSGAPLILACACLGRTGMALSENDAVIIRCQTLLLDGKRTITVDENSIMYTDQLSAAETAGSKE